MADVVIFCGYKPKIKTKPAGAYITANVFRECGYSTIVIDYSNKLSKIQLSTLIEKFVTSNTKYIGLSATLFSEGDVDLEFEWIVDKCKQVNPFLKLIIGGSPIIHGHKTKLPIDYALVGQSESTLIALLRHLEYGDNLQISEEVRGVKYVGDSIYGYSTYNSSQHSKFTEYDAVRPNETLPLEFGRGCVFKCSYCTYDLIGKNFGDYTKTEESMYSVLMHNYEKFGTTRYMFTDDTINDSLEKALLLEKIVNRLPFKFEFGGYMRLELFHKHPEMIEIYKNCGIRGAKFGVETFNKKAGLTVGKGFGEKAKDVLEDLYRGWGDTASISVNFLVGLPYDTLEDLEKQVQWLETTNVVGNCAFNHLRIWKNDKNGFNFKSELINYYTDTSPNDGRVLSNWKSPIMTYQECHKLCINMFDRVIATRNTYVSRYDAFSIPILMEKLPAERLSETINNDLNKILFGNFFNKLADIYYEDLIKINNPQENLSGKLTIPEITAHSNVFESKLVYKKNTALSNN
jgi:radical SAM superfamily enzyme YgiQ (UPF0313 family)